MALRQYGWNDQPASRFLILASLFPLPEFILLLRAEQIMGLKKLRSAPAAVPSWGTLRAISSWLCSSLLLGVSCPQEQGDADAQAQVHHSQIDKRKQNCQLAGAIWGFYCVWFFFFFSFAADKLKIKIQPWEGKDIWWTLRGQSLRCCAGVSTGLVWTSHPADAPGHNLLQSLALEYCREADFAAAVGWFCKQKVC